MSSTIATAKFLFLPGNTAPADAADPTDYTTDFGEARTCIVRPESETKENFIARGGQLVIDDVFPVKQKLTYELQFAHFDAGAIARYFGATDDPMVSKPVKGWGYLSLQSADGEADFLVHAGFRCVIWPEGELNLNGEEHLAWTLMVAVLLANPGSYSTTRT